MPMRSGIHCVQEVLVLDGAGGKAVKTQRVPKLGQRPNVTVVASGLKSDTGLSCGGHVAACDP